MDDNAKSTEEIRAGRDESLARRDGRRNGNYPNRSESHPSKNESNVRHEDGRQYECLAKRDDGLLRNDGGTSRMRGANLTGHGI
jgi:hypothetical protein